ncbi:thioredoxin domain-containing protein [Halobacterium yunchengense]|uniref:thioredoxin domain-containing protein n=1 Tax=Halobacterium yunchengense TaxID=3108497 RepID=UPI00300AEFCF
MSDEPTLTRRSVLQTSGATLGALSLVGTGAASLSSKYETVVDVVEAGADPTGGEPVDDVVEENLDDDTLLEFPDGRYVVNNVDVTGLTNAAIVGTGDATLVPGDDYDVDVWIGGSSLRDFRFEGFTLDNTAAGHHPSVGFSAYDDLVVRDVRKEGRHEAENTAFGVSVWDEDGSALVEGLRMPDGSEPQTAVGVYVDSEGSVTFRDCHVEGFGNNGLYASHSNGPVHVEGGVYKNNDIAQIRLGSPGSSVHDATIAVDEANPDHDNARGVRVADGPGPVEVSSCEIVMEAGEGGGGVVNAYSGGSLRLENSRIYVGEDYTTVGSERTAAAVLVDEPTGIDDPGSTTIRNVAITGGGTRLEAATFRRDDVTVESVCVHQTGTDRNGLVFTDQSQGNVVENVTVNVPGQVIAGGGDVETSGIDSEGTCVLPDALGDGEDGSDADDGADAEDSPTGPPLPQGVHDYTYAVTGTDPGNPTATVYGSFKCPYTQEFVRGNYETVREEFVESGELNLQYRDVAYEPEDPGDPYILDGGRSDLVSRVALGVWDVEPENYWTFFEYVFERQSGLEWTSLEDLTAAMRDAGVRNWGKVRVRVDDGWYESPVEETTAAAREAGVSFVPQLELDGDVTAPHHETEAVLDWIEARL